MILANYQLDTVDFLLIKELFISIILVFKTPIKIIYGENTLKVFIQIPQKKLPCSH